MSSDISISNLIQYFDEKLRQMDRRRIGNNIGKEPQFPMLIVFLGDNAIDGFASLYTRLIQFWPQYRNELIFLGINERNANPECFELSQKNSEVVKEVISLDKLGDRVSMLFGLRSHYQDRSKLLIYYVLDSTNFTEASAFHSWMNAISTVKAYCGVDNVDLLDLLCLLLNENIGERRTIAAEIKNCLYDYIGKTVISAFLLSNRRSDHVILEEWDIVYRIVSDVIALTNNSDTWVTSKVFHAGVYTASYEFEEKPSTQIGQVIIREFIDRLSNESFDSRIAISHVESLKTGLGLSPENTLTILDDYAEQSLYALLPGEDKLSLFPRKDTIDLGDIGSYSEKAFNELTMNSWKCYLGQIVVQAQEHIKRDSSMRNRWREEYSQIISSHFSIGDLIWMKDHPDEVRNLLNNALSPSSETKVLSAAKSQLRYLLSSNKSITEIFVEFIEQLERNAEEFLKSWQMLLRSRLTLHPVRDENLTKFYKRKSIEFFDHNGHSISERFSHISNMDELNLFFKDIIDRIISGDPIFSSAFDEELEFRLNEESEQINAKQYIRDILTGTNVPIYFQANFNLAQPVVSSILLNVSTPLYNNLSDNLSPTIYYYDTGSSNAAEALTIYEVGRDNLISG